MAEINPIRYRGYYYDTETGLYYLGSRYYDPAVKRFVNADGYASTGQGFIGYNMFAYCNNHPIDLRDTDAHSATSAIVTSGMWIPALDGYVPIADILYGIAIVVGLLWDVCNNDDSQPAPDIEYPGDNPAIAPDGYEWTGPDSQGGTRGGYKNKDPNKKDSWHPDLNNKKEGPHWDYNDGNGHKWRVFPDGRIIQDGVRIFTIGCGVIRKTSVSKIKNAGIKTLENEYTQRIARTV